MSLQCKIIDIKASGAFVELLHNGSKVWIPGQEINSNYDQNISLKEQNICRVGDVFDVIDYVKDVSQKHKLYSIVRATNDPWNQIDSWEDGDVKELTIYSVTKNKAYGKIVEGIDGYVRLNDIMSFLTIPEDKLELCKIENGDVLAGYFHKNDVDESSRIIKLNYTKYIKDIKEISEKLINQKPIKLNLEDSLPEILHNSQIRNDIHKISNLNRILIVEDDEKLLAHLVCIMEEFGIDVNTSNSLDGVKNQFGEFDSIHFDLAIIDLHLTNHIDYDGLKVGKYINEHSSETKIILSSADFAHIDKIYELTPDLTISDFLHKPISHEQLRHAFSLALTNEPVLVTDFFNKNNSNKKNKSIEKRKKNTDEIVVELHKKLNATTTVLFKIHPVDLFVKIESIQGPKKEFSKWQRKLTYSPVRDVAIDQESIYEGKISWTSKYRKHKWLFKAFKYESCIGIPIHAASDFAFALFVFHDEVDQFFEQNILETELSGTLISKNIEIARYIKWQLEDNLFYLLGKSYGSMAHDLIGALKIDQEFIDIEKILNDNAVINFENANLISNKTNELKNRWEKADRIVGTFRRISMGIKEKDSLVDVFALMVLAVNNIKFETKPYKIKVAISEKQEDTISETYLRKSALEQVLYNLLLNATQQIHNFSFAREEGSILLEMDNIEKDNEQYIRILVHDTGPGIHTFNKNKIFDVGFTTKDEGLGMGLDICNNIIKSFGGQISLLKSILFIGSTFEIQIPITEAEDN